ncbi:hypothetical protein MMC32_003130 [Xylographa parallela]|nr:hypothetical protein [Xylographa parallela]
MPTKQPVKTTSYIATTATSAAPTNLTTDPTTAIAPPVNGMMEGDAAPVDTVIAPVPLAALTSDADAAVVGTAADGVTELIDTDAAPPDTADVETAAAAVVDTGAAVAAVEIGAADVAVAAQAHTEATAGMTWTPVAAPQAESTQPSAEAWMAAEERHWQW